ncbi:MAG: hypothetical protein ACRDD1_19350 [Planctomycetia bacterium]
MVSTIGSTIETVDATPGGTADVLWTLADHLGSVRDLLSYNDATNTTTVANHVE